MNLPGAPHQVNAVGYGGHKSFGEAETPVAVLEIGQHANGVAARISGVVPGAIVVGRPVDELKVRVGTDRILIEEIGQAEFSEANFETAAGQLIEQRQKAALVLDVILAQRENFVNHAAAEIGSFA